MAMVGPGHVPDDMRTLERDPEGPLPFDDQLTAAKGTREQQAAAGKSEQWHINKHNAMGQKQATNNRQQTMMRHSAYKTA